MKYLLPVVMLAAAAWATRGEPHGALARAQEQSREPERSQPEVPWLNEAFAEEFSAIVEGDPHAGLYGDEDPHAGLYGEGESTEQLVAGACPRAVEALAEEGDEFGADPHAAEMHGEDPHAGARSTRSAELPAQGVARSKARNGHTIAELYARRSTLAEHAVSVRGVVVKRTDGILGESYLHLQDGSGSAAHQDNDLTITTTEELALGDTVEVQGLVRIDRDLGLGYRYAVMLTGATRASLQ